MPYALVVCLFLLAATLFAGRLSLPYFAIAIAVGLIGSVISADELTGGRALAWLHGPLLVAGLLVAQSLSSANRTRWVLILQYIAAALVVELVLLTIFRSKIISFRERKVQMTLALQHPVLAYR